jgi:predicted ATP-dependent endonuclease of OLD family
MTALIGPRGIGKSRLLLGIAWLLTGSTELDGSFAESTISAEIVDANGARLSVSRGPAASPDAGASLPAVTFLAARARVPAPPDAPVGSRSDAAAAEQMLAMIAERRLGGAEGELLLIEEPELMLAPQQQRHLYRLLRRYAEKNQVIYSTRAPALLDATYFEEIIRLDRTTAGTSVRRARRELLNDYQRLRIQAEFDHERTEMFFASAVVLVEGQTERLALPLIFRRLGQDPDALGISIVEVGGKGNLGLVARVLAEMGIPHVIVHDSDRGRQASIDNAEIRREAGNAPVIELRPDFEGAAGIRSHEDKVFDAWTRFSKIDPEDIPDIFKRIVETTARLAHGSPAGR